MNDEMYNIKGLRRQKKRLKEVKSMPKHSLTSIRIIAEQIVKKDRDRLEDQRVRESNRRKVSEE